MLVGQIINIDKAYVKLYKIDENSYIADTPRFFEL
jgi:hypothetical protein